MPDYQCWPLWREDRIENVDPGTLGIAPALCDRLLDWAAQFDATLNSDDPASSGFGSPEAETRFESVGRRLALELQRELGGATKVRYWRDTP